MPRRYYPVHSGLLGATGVFAPAWDRFVRDLLYVPAWVRAAEQATLDVALSPRVIVPATPVAPSAPPPPAPALPKTQVYRLSYYVHVMQAATVSSDVQVTLTWTEQGVPQTYTGALLSGNTTTTLEHVTELSIVADIDQPIEVETTYTSVGDVPMLYDIDVAYELAQQLMNPWGGNF